MGTIVDLQEPHERSFQAYCAPAESPRLVAVLLLPEMFGLTAAMRSAADSFAAEGLTTLVPNLFWRSEHPQTLGYEGAEREVAQHRFDRFDLAFAVQDANLAARWLQHQFGTSLAIVAVGHCVGGRVASRAMEDTWLAGAVSYYGMGISSQGAALARLRGPVQLHYGSADPVIPNTEVEHVKALLDGNPNVDVFEYADAGHSFCNPNRPMYNHGFASVVHKRTLRLVACVENAMR